MTHKPRTTRQKRDDDRIYSSARWRRLRAQKLARDPLCEDCKDMGITKAAEVVDHRHAITKGGNPFPPLDDLSSKCWPCHSAKTARGAEAGAAKTSKPRKGCNPDGSPLDPAHPWSQGPGGRSEVEDDGDRYAGGEVEKYLISEGGQNG